MARRPELDVAAPPAAVSARMARVGQKDTAPEMAVRRAAHALGYRFRLHRRDLPGSPDLVFPRHRALVFVHGCFWHRHEGCRRATTPAANRAYWQVKFERNVMRDLAVFEQLGRTGWRVLVVWECETRDGEGLRGKLAVFLGPAGGIEPQSPLATI